MSVKQKWRGARTGVWGKHCGKCRRGPRGFLRRGNERGEGGCTLEVVLLEEELPDPGIGEDGGEARGAGGGDALRGGRRGVGVAHGPRGGARRGGGGGGSCARLVLEVESPEGGAFREAGCESCDALVAWEREHWSRRG